MSRRGPGQGLPEAVAAGQTAGGWDAHQGAGRGRGGGEQRRDQAEEKTCYVGQTGTPGSPHRPDGDAGSDKPGQGAAPGRPEVAPRLDSKSLLFPGPGP